MTFRLENPNTDATQRPAPVMLALVAMLSLGGCQTGSGVTRSNEPAKQEFTAFGDTFAGMKTVSDTEYYASDQLVAAAKTQFREENYGNAGALFYKAVQMEPKDSQAWLGLAASSDRIHRFDLSDKAYKQFYGLEGGTLAYYNNVGYSHLLRGDMKAARNNFLKAYELAPDDPTVVNNLKMLGSSAAYVQR